MLVRVAHNDAHHTGAGVTPKATPNRTASEHNSYGRDLGLSCRDNKTKESTMKEPSAKPHLPGGCAELLEDHSDSRRNEYVPRVSVQVIKRKPSRSFGQRFLDAVAERVALLITESIADDLPGIRELPSHDSTPVHQGAHRCACPKPTD